MPAASLSQTRRPRLFAVGIGTVVVALFCSCGYLLWPVALKTHASLQVPRYPNIVGNERRESLPLLWLSDQQWISFTTPDSADAVRQYYRRELAQVGWYPDLSMNSAPCYVLVISTNPVSVALSPGATPIPMTAVVMKLRPRTSASNQIHPPCPRQ